MTVATKAGYIAGIIGAIWGFVFASGMKYFLVPFPESTFVNEMNHVTSGLFAGFFAVFSYLKKSAP